jgi:hypothetical protein
MGVFNEAFTVTEVSLGQMKRMIVSEELKQILKKGLYRIVG